MRDSFTHMRVWENGRRKKAPTECGRTSPRCYQCVTVLNIIFFFFFKYELNMPDFSTTDSSAKGVVKWMQVTCRCAHS